MEPLGEPPADPLLQDVSAIAVDTQPADQSSGTFRIQLSRKWRLALACCLLIIVAGSNPLWRSIAKDRATAQAQQRSYLRVGIAPFEADGSDASGLAESFRLDITDALAQVPQLRVGASHVSPANTERGRG